jgi:hypothetical protein
MKNSRNNSGSDFTKTCETEQYDTTDRRDFQNTVYYKPGVLPSFKHDGFIQKILQNSNSRPLNTNSSDEEDVMCKNWLPEPCFVHFDSMDYPTPKISFLPNKPFYSWNS